MGQLCRWSFRESGESILILASFLGWAASEAYREGGLPLNPLKVGHGGGESGLSRPSGLWRSLLSRLIAQVCPALEAIVCPVWCWLLCVQTLSCG